MLLLCYDVLWCDERESGCHISHLSMLCVAVLTWYWASLLPVKVPLATTQSESSYLPPLPVSQGRPANMTHWDHFLLSSSHWHTATHCHPSVPPVFAFCNKQQDWSTFLFHLARHHQSNKEIINQEFREMENPALTQPDQDIWVIPAVGPCQCQGFYLLSA